MTKTITIELYDMESMFIFGITKLPLDYLLLRSEPMISKVYELEVCNPENGLKLGAL